MKTLKQFAKEHAVTYRTAWNRFKDGKIPNAYKDEYGKILIQENNVRPDYVVCYARVSSSQNLSNLESQAQRLVQFCNASGIIVNEVVKECGSGLNDTRKKLLRILEDPKVTKIVVEHKDRLTRFGFNYLERWMKMKNCELIVLNKSPNDKVDLMQDFVSLVTSFTARLYGLRRTRRKTEEIIQNLSKND